MTWNLAGRVKRLGEQARRRLALDADLLCLQEMTASTLPLWQELLQAAGYPGIEHNEPQATEDRRRPLAVLPAARTPRKELADGRVWTFARDRYGHLRADRGAEWEQAELSLIRGLQSFGFRDAFRELHGWEEPALSWEWPRWGGGYRLDHLFVSGFDVESCFYEHRWRREGLSDHSPLIAKLKQEAGRATGELV